MFDLLSDVLSSVFWLDWLFQLTPLQTFSANVRRFFSCSWWWWWTRSWSIDRDLWSGSNFESCTHRFVFISFATFLAVKRQAFSLGGNFKSEFRLSDFDDLACASTFEIQKQKASFWMKDKSACFFRQFFCGSFFHPLFRTQKTLYFLLSVVLRKKEIILFSSKRLRRRWPKCVWSSSLIFDQDLELSKALEPTRETREDYGFKREGTTVQL